MEQLMVLMGVGYVFLCIALYTYDYVKTKKELGEWKNDRAENH